MAKVELVYPQSASIKEEPPIRFEMTVKEGPYEKDLSDEQFQGQLRGICSLPVEETVFVVGAMNSQMDLTTGRMMDESRKLVETIDSVCEYCMLYSLHCFGLQEFGKYRVTSAQATLRDGILVQRSSRFIALETTPESNNAPIEVRYRLGLGRSVIALFNEANPRPEYREWFIEQVRSRPHTDPKSYMLTYNGLSDLARALPQLLSDGIPQQTKKIQIA